MFSTVRLLVFFWLLLPYFFAAQSASATETRSRLEIFPRNGGGMLYEGDRVTTEEKEQVKVAIVYRKVGGAPLVTEEWAYQKSTLKLIYQKMTNLMTGQMESMVLEGEMVVMQYQQNSKAPVKHGKLKMDDNMVHSGLLASLLKLNWEKLEKGEELSFNLLVPSQLATLGFRVKKDSVQEIGGESVMILRVEPNSWVVSRLLNPLYFYHSRTPPHRMLEFRGRSSISKDNGETQDLRTVYIPVQD